MRKFICSLAVIINMFTISVNAISAKSAILIDSASGRILYEKNAYQKLPMASTTKIMTGLLACESGKLDEYVKVSPFASGTEGSSLWLEAGQQISFENLLYGLMLKSGNDAAVAIAEHIGGSVEAFALLMNQKAKAIGLKNTNFENPHGLDSENHYTTAYDLSMIAREAMKNEKFAQVVSTKKFFIKENNGEWSRSLKNHNKLLWMYDGCNGVKTGYTKKCGRCLVSSAEKDGTQLICVTLSAPDDWKDHTYLLDYGFNNYDTVILSKKGEKACHFTYNKKYKKSTPLVFSEEFKIAKNESDNISTEIELRNVKLPAKKGAVAGYAYFFCNGEKIGSVELITTKKIKNVSILEKIKYKFVNFIKNTD